MMLLRGLGRSAYSPAMEERLPYAPPPPPPPTTSFFSKYSPTQDAPTTATHSTLTVQTATEPAPTNGDWGTTEPVRQPVYLPPAQPTYVAPTPASNPVFVEPAPQPQPAPTPQPTPYEETSTPDHPSYDDTVTVTPPAPTPVVYTPPSDEVYQPWTTTPAEAATPAQSASQAVQTTSNGATNWWAPSAWIGAFRAVSPARKAVAITTLGLALVGVVAATSVRRHRRS